MFAGMSAPLSLDLANLNRLYQTGEATPLDILDAIYARMRGPGAAGVYISEVPQAAARARASELMARRAAGEALPLYGIPFAVKDNIDVAGLETTAACPAFAYRARASAHVVERLLQAGAIVLGKTNLDQFATGLVGVRSPYPAPENPWGSEYVPGGSSSGSGVAVARGLVSFALGTDTAGSGRVPAAFNNVVGLKPTRGMLSTHGVVPACRALDCVSVFALTVSDAARVTQLMAAYDPRDPYSRRDADAFEPRPGPMPAALRVAIPDGASLVIHEPAARAVFEHAVAALDALSCKRSQRSLAAFSETAQLLYQGPFVAERLEASGALLEREPEAIQPVVRGILEAARKHSALDAYAAQAKLSGLRRDCHAALHDCDVLLVPSTSLFPRVADVLADPIGINSELGRYTNFVNLLDLCALAVPAGLRADGLPFGVTLIARAGQDALLASLGQALHGRLGTSLGATSAPLPAPDSNASASASASAQVPGEHTRLAVVGAHLSGQPLNHELTSLGARLLSATHTAASYRLYALPTQPPKPGLVRVAPGQSAGPIELEVWELTFEAFGRFVARIPAPLGIGSIELASGERVQGFVCESAAVSGADARDITHFGGWRAYLTSTNKARAAGA